MEFKQITPFLSVSAQLGVGDIGIAAAHGFKSIVNNRPDGESDDQPEAAAIEQAAIANGLAYRHIPVVSGKVADDDVEAFAAALGELKGPVLAFCRTGTRSSTLWALSEAWHLEPDAILAATPAAGYDLSGLLPRLEVRARTGALAEAAMESRDMLPKARAAQHDVVIVGGGAGGISVASGLLKRRPELDVAIVEPREFQYYQPGWTLVGGGVFDRAQTERRMADVMPKGVHWIRSAAAAFEPDRNEVVLEDGERIGYRVLVAAPGIKLDWDGIEGLKQTLGKNGVTSNYLFDMAPYTWELVQSLRSGTALFTQPPMPIKCAGAPQKAMYLACDYWRRTGRLKDIDVAFKNAGGVLFGVKNYVPALMNYVDRYGIDLDLNQNLVAVDGPAKTAWFDVKQEDGSVARQERRFDMMHVCPPQKAPDSIRVSPLAAESGWIEVNDETLQHARFGNVFGLGDACSAPNAKTAAAIRKQAPVVAENVVAVLDDKAPRAIYDGYGSCPLTVERGKIVMAEFGYGGKLLPTFPTWLVDGTKPSARAWFLKEKMLPPHYWHMLLKGREWWVEPEILPHTPTPFEAQPACETGQEAAVRQG